MEDSAKTLLDWGRMACASAASKVVNVEEMIARRGALENAALESVVDAALQITGWRTKADSHLEKATVATVDPDVDRLRDFGVEVSDVATDLTLVAHLIREQAERAGPPVVSGVRARLSLCAQRLLYLSREGAAS